MKTLGARIGTADTRRVRPPEKRVDPYYLTQEHRAWCSEVIRRAGGRCQSCGRRGCRLFADHIVELKDGGEPGDPANGRGLCGRCHTLKTNAARATRMRGGVGVSG